MVLANGQNFKIALRALVDRVEAWTLGLNFGGHYCHSILGRLSVVVCQASGAVLKYSSPIPKFHRVLLKTSILIFKVSSGHSL